MRKVGLLGSIISLVAMGMFFTPSAISAYESTKIKPNFIKVNTVKYRRGAAETAQLGSIGSKKNRVGKVPIFIRHQVWNAGRLNVTQETVLTLTSNQINTLSGEGHTTTAGGTTISGNINTSSELSGSFVLAKYTLNDNDIISRINSLSKSKRKQIKKYKNGRIVTSIWVLLSGQEQQSGTYSGSLSMDQQTTGGTVTLTHASRSQISFSPNTIIAYEYKTMKWKKGKKLKKLKRDGVWR